MAFPGKFDISYYKGDTYEFRIYPKDNSGAQFNLASYSTSPKFTISNTLGTPSAGQDPKVVIEGYAQVSDDYTYVTCAITPSNGANMTAGTNYVYDVQISQPFEPYDYVYTLLSGTISVSEQVTEPGVPPSPNPPRNVLIEEVTATAVTISWTAPPVGVGSAISGYKLYRLSDPEDFGTATFIEQVSSSTLNYTFGSLSSNTQYGFVVKSYNDGGNSIGAGNYTTTLSGS